MSKPDVVCWMCPHCEKLSMWKWERGEAIEGPITTFCEGGCEKPSDMTMHRVDKRFYVATPRKKA